MRPLTAKEHSAVVFYTDPGSETFNNWQASFLKAKYSDKGHWQANALRVRRKDVIEQAIQVYRDSVKADLDITRGEVRDNARWLVENGKKKGIGADVKAGNGQLGSMIGVYQQVIDDKRDKLPEMDPLTRAAHEAAAKEFSEFIARGGPKRAIDVPCRTLNTKLGSKVCPDSETG